MEEEFRDVIGYEGLYQVSNLGNVKSLSRFRKGKNESTVTVKEKILKPGANSVDYLVVGLCKNGKRSTKKVHQLVAIAFLGHIPNGYKIVVDHVDNDTRNNKANNLQLIPQRLNSTKDTKSKYSKYKGLNYDKTNDSWRGKISSKGKIYYTKTVTTETEAYCLYKLLLNELNLVNYNEIN